MLPYSSYTKPEAKETSLLRVLGGILALLSILLTVLGIIFHHGVLDLALSIIVGIFAVRVLILWLGDKPQSAQKAIAKQPVKQSPVQSAMYSMQAPPYVGQQMGQPVPYTVPNSQPQPFYQTRTQAIPPPMHIPPGQSTPAPQRVPHAVQLQRQPIPGAQFPAQSAQPVQPGQLSQSGQPGQTQQPPVAWPAPPYQSASVPMPMPQPKQEGKNHA